MSTAVDTMKNFFNVMQHYSADANADGVALLDDAVRTVSHFANLQHAINNFVYDTTNTSAYADTAQRLKATSGIVLGADYDYTADTGAITGKNAGGDTVKNAVEIVPETSNLTDLPLPSAGTTTTHTYTGNDGQTFTFYVKWPESFTSMYDYRTVTEEMMNNMTVEQNQTYLTDVSSFSDYNDEAIGTATLTGAQLISGMETVIKGLYNFWLEESFKLAYDSYGLDFNGKTIEIKFAGGGWATSFQAATGPDEESQEVIPTDKISMSINAPRYAIIDSIDPNGNTRISGGTQQGYLDRTIAHELIHAVMFGKGIMKKNEPEFFTEGVAELVQGLDDWDEEQTGNIKSLAENSDSLSGAMALAAGTGTNIRYVSGYMFLRYLCQQSLNTHLQIGNNSSPVTFGYDGGENIIVNYKSADKINYVTDFTGFDISGDDLVFNSSTGRLYVRDVRDQVVNISDYAGNVGTYAYMASGAGEINGSNYDGFELLVGANDSSNTITIGNGGGSLWGGGGNVADVLSGGIGQDVFFYGYGNGNDVINNANSNDVVELFGMTMADITSANITDNGVDLQFADGGSLTVGGQAEIFLLDSTGQTYIADYQNKIWEGK